MLLSWGHGGWVYFFTKHPVANIEGLRKSKMFIWAGDDQMVNVWKQKGFNPVPLAATDIMTGLQTGMIDAYPDDLAARPHAAVVPLDAEHGRHGHGAAGRRARHGKAAWNKLPAADRAKVQAACDKMERRLELEVPRQDTTAVAEMQKRGLKVNAVGTAERGRVQEGRGGVRDGARRRDLAGTRPAPARQGDASGDGASTDQRQDLAPPRGATSRPVASRPKPWNGGGREASVSGVRP